MSLSTVGIPTMFVLACTTAHALKDQVAWDSIAGGIAMACLTQVLSLSPFPGSAWLLILPSLLVLFLTLLVGVGECATIL